MREGFFFYVLCYIGGCMKIVKEIYVKSGEAILVDADKYEWLNGYKWHLSSGYASTTTYINKQYKTLYMHRLILGLYSSSVYCDHINRNKFDNRLSNLRAVSQSINMLNASIRSDNTSGYKGIYYDNQRGKWRAQITIEGIVMRLGRFDTLEQAIMARQYKEIELDLLQ